MATNTADMVFKNGLIVTPAGTVEGGVAILNGKIAAVGGDAFLPAAKREIDLAGKYLLPGVIDPECHLGSHRPLADDFYSETRAAAAAGVTTWGMQLVSLAITGGAEKVKGPADIPSFTRAMPLYYEASRAAAIDFFLTPILGTDEHVERFRTWPGNTGSLLLNCTCKCRGRGNLPGRRTRLTTAAFTPSSMPSPSSARRPSRCSTARIGRLPASSKNV